MDLDQININDDIKYYIEQVGDLPTTNLLKSEELEVLKEALHKEIVRYFKAFGRSVWCFGKMQTCYPKDYRAILALIFQSDAEFNHNDYKIFAYSAFGLLYVWHTTYGLTKIDLLAGSVESKGLYKSKHGAEISGQQNLYIFPFSSTANDTNNAYDEDGEKIFDRCVEKLGPVGIGECFGFFPAIALGGVSNVENVRKVHAFEHFSFLAQLQPFYWVHTEVDFETGRLEKTIVREVGKMHLS